MPTKKPTNKLSQMYKNIDQKELSQEAKDTLTKLRLATANFAKKEGKEADAFILFYNRLVSKKPTAVKTTKEYKDMKTERRRETGRKAMEARKAKEESRQGQGSERDAARPAKPFGWRLKGKHNYRKPTRADISSGRAYYEARINRADSKRTKFPMLERGGSLDGKYVIFYKEYENGKLIVEKHKEFNSYLSAKRELNKLASNHEHSYMLTDMETFMDMYGDRFERGGFMAKGGGVSTKYVIVDENTDRIYFRSTDKKLVELKFKEFKEIYPNVNLSIIEFPNQYANGGYMAKGGLIAYADGDYDNRVGVFTSMLDAKKFAKANKWRYETITFEDESGDNIVVSKDDTFKDVDFLFSNDFANGGFMAKGGEIHVVLNEGNGKIINKLYNDWNNVKTEKEYKKWVEQVRSTKFGTYGTLTYDEVLKNFDFDNAPINSFHLKTFKSELKNALDKGYEYAKGGAIENQYEGRTPEDIWNSYSKDQRLHFLYDHSEEINEYKAIESEDEKPWFNVAYKSNWDDLDMDVKNRFANHVRGGQYANGGEVDKGGMIYALRNEISGGTIANKSGVDSYDDIAKVRRMAIQYYMENGDAPYSLGELDRVLARVGEEMGTKMSKGGEIGDNGIITDKNSFFTGKMGLIVGELDPKTWLVRVGDRTVVVPKKGIDIVSSDDEYAKGGYMSNGGVFYKESHKLGHE